MSKNYALTSQLVWQKPNATEFTSAQILSSQFYNGSSNYLPFPWATWIDSFRKNGKTYPSPKALQNGGIRATVCQHIWAIEHLDIFKNAGITDIFCDCYN